MNVGQELTHTYISGKETVDGTSHPVLMSGSYGKDITPSTTLFSSLESLAEKMFFLHKYRDAIIVFTDRRIIKSEITTIDKIIRGQEKEMRNFMSDADLDKYINKIRHHYEKYENNELITPERVIRPFSLDEINAIKHYYEFFADNEFLKYNHNYFLLFSPLY